MLKRSDGKKLATVTNGKCERREQEFAKRDKTTESETERISSTVGKRKTNKRKQQKTTRKVFKKAWKTEIKAKSHLTQRLLQKPICL